jgi:hypothetical protein
VTARSGSDATEVGLNRCEIDDNASRVCPIVDRRGPTPKVDGMHRDRVRVIADRRGIFDFERGIVPLSKRHKRDSARRGRL